METDSKNLAEHKLDYLKLAIKILKLRCRGKEPPFELIMQAQVAGRLAHIPDDQIDNLLIQSEYSVPMNPLKNSTP